MSAWLKKNKAILVLMGVVFVALALVVVPAYVKTAYDIQAAGETKGFILIFVESINNIQNFSENL